MTTVLAENAILLPLNAGEPGVSDRPVASSSPGGAEGAEGTTLSPILPAYRLLRRRADTQEWAWIRVPVGTKEVPEWVPEADILHRIETEELTLADRDPYAPINGDIGSSPAERRDADRWWSIIRPLLEDEFGAVLFRAQRAKRIRARAEECEVSEKSVYRQLRRAWEGGQVRDALLPRYRDRGGRGKAKSAGEKKRGAPGGEVRPNVTPEIAEKLIAGGKEFYIKQKLPWTASYEETKRQFFHQGTTELFGHTVPEALPQEECPTLEQFKYWVNKYITDNEISVVRNREGRYSYQNDHRQTLHRASLREEGPGALYEVDATVADVHLLSAVIPDQLVGRPVLHVVMDVFSLMVVGFFVALEGPNWLGMMSALHHAFTPKAEFCKRYGFEIEEADWPSHHLCRALLGDRGELLSANADWLTERLFIRVSNAPPRRPAWKPHVERHFRTINDLTIQFLPGHANIRQPGEPNCQYDATLTVDDFVAVLTSHFLAYNRTHEIADPDSIPPGYPVERLGNPTPLEAWHWGVQERSGLLRSATADQVRAALLPRGRARVYSTAVEFNGLRYAPPELLRRGRLRESDLASWFIRRWRRRSAPRSVLVQWDPRSVGVLLVYRRPDLPPDEFALVKSDQRFDGTTIQEVEHVLEFEKQAIRAARKARAQEATMHRSLREGIVQRSGSRRNGRPRPSVRDIREAKKEEAIARAKAERWLGNGTPTPAPESPEPRKTETPEADGDYMRRSDYLGVIRRARGKAKS